MNTLCSVVLALHAPTYTSASVDEPLRRVSAHYAAVLDELRAADASHLAPQARAGRADLLDVLDAYRRRGEFGRADSAGARVPWFVDGAGRRCAVAELLHATGEHELVERVRASRNHAWILELHAEREFARWLARHGLSFDEAARIQCPAIDGGAQSTGGGGAPAGGNYGGPGDTVAPTGGGGGTPAPPSAPGQPGPGSKGGGAGQGPAAPSGTPRGGGAPTAVTLTTTSDDGWWLWWEYAKAEFLVPNRLLLANAITTGGDAAGALREAVERARRAELPRFLEAARAGDAGIRASAATALGASGGRDAIEPLLRLLDDPNQDVRHRAILGLGATGATAAAIPLLAIARTGAHVADGRSGTSAARERVSPYARGLAFVALGVARRAGLDQPVDAALAALVRAEHGADRDTLAIAAMFHHVLAPGAALEVLAQELALDERAPPSVRCRAVEALATTRDPAVLARLQTLLSGARLDLRRSAALALGASRDTRVLPALTTAFELEAEVLTRGLILIGIGRLGGAQAHAFLVKVLDQGNGGERRWASLALGILARETADPETASALRAALERENSAEGRAAHWLALGLVRDEASVALLGAELARAADPRQRMYAATALALVRGARSAAILRGRLTLETNALARAGIAQALGIAGENQDVVAIRDALDRLAESGLQGLAASALAFHGTPEALAALAELAWRDGAPRVCRAAAIEGLGLILTRSEPLRLTNLSRRMNYTVMPDWAASMFQSTL